MRSWCPPSHYRYYVPVIILNPSISFHHGSVLISSIFIFTKTSDVWLASFVVWWVFWQNQQALKEVNTGKPNMAPYSPYSSCVSILVICYHISFNIYSIWPKFDIHDIFDNRFGEKLFIKNQTQDLERRMFLSKLKTKNWALECFF